MLVCLLKDCAIAPRGIHVSRHKEGEVLDLPEGLASSMIRAGQARAEPQAQTQEDVANMEPVATPKALQFPTPKKRYRNQGES